MKLQETKDERRLDNYQKYLKHWDKYEEQIKEHFDEKVKRGQGTSKDQGGKSAILEQKKKLYPTIRDLVSDDKNITEESLYNNLGAVSLAHTMNESIMALEPP